MEFETNETASQPQHETYTRLEAANRHLTVTPLHNEISADDLPDEQVAALHAVAPAIANAPIDIEVTAPAPTVPAVAPHHSHQTAWIAASVAALIICAAIIFFAFITISQQ